MNLDLVGIIDSDKKLVGELQTKRELKSSVSVPTVINAYSVAVANGFTGSVQEWLDSLKGKDGYTPIKGIDYFDGKDGVNGINGRDGKDGRNGTDGTNGINGRNGIDGKDGTNGKDGKTPVKGVDYFTEEDIRSLGVDAKADKSEIPDLTPYATIEYVDDSLYDSMHRKISTRKIDTHQRNFTDANWSYYGSIGHVENWSNTANYNDFKVGDFGVLYGTNTTNNKYVALVGEVTQVTSSLQMRTLACYQTDEYKEVTEYGVDIAKDLLILG